MSDETNRSILMEIRERVKALEPIAKELQERDFLRHKLEGIRLLSPDAGSRVLGDVIANSLRVWDSNMTEDEAHRLIADIADFINRRAPGLSCNLRIFAREQHRVHKPSGWSVETDVKGYKTLWANPVVWEYMRERWLEVCEALLKLEDDGKLEELIMGDVPACEKCGDNGWNGRCPDCGRFSTDETLWEINQALIKRLKSGEPWLSEKEKEALEKEDKQ